MTTEFLKFLVTGGTAALATLTSRYLLNFLMPFEIAVIIAYLIGMLIAYALARLLVFPRSGRSVATELKRFTIVNIFALVLVWGVSVGLARIVFPAMEFFWHSDDIAHLIGVLSPAIPSYLGHRHFTFSRGSA